MSIPALTVIGLDAATFDVIDPLVEAGELPTLARLLDGGARGSLRSTTHPLTPLAWTTMTTGVNAGRHGIWDFTERDETGYGLRIVNGSHSRAPAVWSRLSAAGRRVGIVNVPFTWPAPDVDGFVLAGMDAAAREDGMTSPRDLIGELQSRFGRLLLDHTFPLDRRGRLDVELVRESCAQKAAIVDWLVSRYSPELLFVVFMAADHVHHLAWPDWEERGPESRVAEVYRILDSTVGKLLGRLGDDANVLVVSDHGGGALRGVVNLNAWLAEQGYLEYASAPGYANGNAARLPARRLYELWRRLPRELRYSLKQRLPGLRERAYGLGAPSVIDWQRTQAFAYGSFGSVVLNVAGREQFGVVPPGEPYERLREELRERLLDLRWTDGQRIVAAVHRREDLFVGPELDRIPDLIVELRDYAWLGKGNLVRRTPTLEDTISIRAHPDQLYVGSHRPDGVFVLSGPAARAGAELHGGVADVAPTILYLLGEPIPAELEGRLLAEALEPSLLDSRPPEFVDQEIAGAALAGAPTALASPPEVEERLRDLGYVE
ncbi:MAG TPA: alkaline phosphatase family protein [Gaiellaceae bacterium]|nr:alkaline phosphatase family protein [Gaiellaceae bacterium]